MLYIFDMGGVVTNTAKVNRRIAEHLNISLEKFNEISGNEKEGLFHQLTVGDISAKEYWAVFSKLSGIKVNCDFWHLFFHLQLNNETVDIIKKLKHQGHRVICGTNTIESHYMNHIERGDYSFFDQTYASHIMGIAKPNPDFFRLILKAEDVLAENCTFIDDKEENCKAAESVGIKSILFSTASELAKKLELNNE